MCSHSIWHQELVARGTRAATAGGRTYHAPFRPSNGPPYGELFLEEQPEASQRIVQEAEEAQDSSYDGEVCAKMSISMRLSSTVEQTD
jgi:hypothetical protein